MARKEPGRKREEALQTRGVDTGAASEGATCSILICRMRGGREREGRVLDILNVRRRGKKKKDILP